MRREYRHRLQRKLLISDPGMYHGTCVTHVPWCMSGSLTRGGGENVPGIPGACANRNFTYLARGPLCKRPQWAPSLFSVPCCMWPQCVPSLFTVQCCKWPCCLMPTSCSMSEAAYVCPHISSPKRPHFLYVKTNFMHKKILSLLSYSFTRAHDPLMKQQEKSMPPDLLTIMYNA